MTYRTIAVALLSGLVLTPVATTAKTPIALHPVDVKLPESSRVLPDGPNVAVVHDNCTGCHSVGMILNQPTMPKAAWEAEVAKMRNVYKAPVEQKDVAAIVDYLAAVKGPK
jgi:cytochrome c5